MPVSEQDRDMMIRTVLGESSDQPPEGQAAVAHVIMTRAKSGRYGGSTPTEVVLAPNQFEPWQTRAKELQAISTNSKAYQRVGKIVDGVLAGEIADPTNGASHFLEENIVRARRGGTLPTWARGEGMKIGGHTFYYPDAQNAPAQNRTIPMELAPRGAPQSPRLAMDAISAAISGSGGQSAAMPVNAMQFADNGGQPMATRVATQAVPAESQNLLDLWDAAPTQNSAPKAAPVTPQGPQQADPNGNLLDLWDTQTAPAPTAPAPQQQTQPAAVANAQPSPSMTTGIVRSLAEGVPIIGALPNKLNAITQAAAAPVIPGDKTISQAPSFWDRYSQNLAREQGTSAAFEREHPVISTAANIAGGTAATLPVAATGVGAGFLGLIGKTVPQRMMAGAASGAGIGAADAGLRGQDATTGAIAGGVLGAAAPPVGRAIGAGVEKLRNIVSPSRTEIPSSEAIRDAATAGYDKIRSLDVRLRPAAIQNLASNVMQDLHGDGLREKLAPKTFGMLDELVKPVSGNPNTTFSDLHAIRRVLGKVAASPDQTEKMAATRVINSLDSYLENVPTKDILKGDISAANQTFKEANANYAASKRADILAGKISQAELQAGSANSGQNIDNATRQRIKDILKSDKLKRGFSEEERSEMEKVVKGTASGNMLRRIGNMLGGGGGFPALVAAGEGGLAGYAATGGNSLTAIGAGIAAPLVGSVVKKAGNKITERSVNKLDEMIRSRAPFSQGAVNANQLAQILHDARLGKAEKFGALMGRSGEPNVTQALKYTPEGYPYYDQPAR